jgi:hypothetical protein
MIRMRKLFLMGLAVLYVTLMPSLTPAQSAVEATPLNNRDVIFMVGRKLDNAAIVRIIESSPCTFDTFPPVLREMKRRGVGDAVLQAMVEAPYGPSAERAAADDLGEAPIYHYAEQLKQMGFLIPTKAARGRQPTRQRARASRSRRQ